MSPPESGVTEDTGGPGDTRPTAAVPPRVSNGDVAPGSSPSPAKAESDPGRSSADRNPAPADQGTFEDPGYASTSDFSGSAYSQVKDSLQPKAAPADEAGYASADETAFAPRTLPTQDEAGYASADMSGTTGSPVRRRVEGRYAVSPLPTPGATPGPTTPGPGQTQGPRRDVYSQVKLKSKGGNPSSRAGRDMDGWMDT